jgi:hypothetical protein
MQVAAQSVTVVESRRLPSSDPARRGKYDRILICRIGEGPPWPLVVADELPAEQLVALVKAEAGRQVSIVGRPIPL